MHGPHLWSASSLKALPNGSFRARSFRASPFRAIWPGPMAQVLFPPSSDCTAVPGCMTRQSKGWPMNLSPGAMSSCSSTAMQRVVAQIRLHIERVCHLRQAQAGCLRGSHLLRQPNLRRSTSCGCGRLLGRRPGYPLGGGAKFVRTVRPFRQFTVPGGGCVLSSMQAGNGTPGNPDADLHRRPRRLDPGGKTAPIKSPAGATTGRLSSWLSIPALPMDSHYRHLQPGTTMFDHWLEYNGEAADDASHRLHRFLDRYLN